MNKLVFAAAVFMAVSVTHYANKYRAEDEDAYSKRLSRARKVQILRDLCRPDMSSDKESEIPVIISGDVTGEKDL